jgi:hypothetical protein
MALNGTTVMTFRPRLAGFITACPCLCNTIICAVQKTQINKRKHRTKTGDERKYFSQKTYAAERIILE